MHIDWTLNISDMLTIAGVLSACGAIIWQMNKRLMKVEYWIELEGGRADKALNVLETVGTALAKVSACYEMTIQRIDNMEDRLNRHHEDVSIHQPRKC